ncbi:MAG: hypothetical protein KGS72_05650 [Cyanobacteria bacterium REEB67]|nr:hypothetical protein [Cyanobacteria bacterium REEB67]
MNVGPLSRLMNTKVKSSSDNWRSLLESGKEAQGNRQYEEAEQFYAAAYDEAKERLGEKNIVISEILMQVATLKEATGNIEGAKAIRGRARKIIADFAASQDETKQA